MTTYHATKHAVRRYQERVERCRLDDASDRVLHAASISRLATARQVAHCRKRKKGRVITHGAGVQFRWCEVEGLLLVIAHKHDCDLVLTVSRCQSDAELRAAATARRRGNKLARKSVRHED